MLYINFLTAYEEEQKKWHFSWIPHCIVILLCLPYCTLHYEGAKQPQKMTRQGWERAYQTPSQLAAGTASQASGASLQAVAHLHSKSQLKLLPQRAATRDSTWVTTLSKHNLTAPTGARSSLTGSWWILLINANCANLIHGLWLNSHLEYADNFTRRHVLLQS